MTTTEVEAQLAHCGDILAIAKSMIVLLQRPRATFYLSVWSSFSNGGTLWPRIEARVMKARNLRGYIDFDLDAIIVKKPARNQYNQPTTVPIAVVEYADPQMQEKVFAFVKQVTRARKKSTQIKKARKEKG